MESLENCPLFTDQHSHHNPVWSVPGFTLPTLCIACVIERLDKKEELLLHARKVLSELRALLGKGNESKILKVLKSDKRVLERLCGQLFGLLTSQDVTNVELAMEVLVTLMNFTQDIGDLVLKLLHTTIHTVMCSQSFPCSLPHLTFLGKLLHSNPGLNNVVIRSYCNFLEFAVGGLTYPDDPVKSSVVYVLVQVCSKGHPNSLSLPLVQDMCRSISTNLATAKSQELTINLLGLVRHLLKSGTYTQCLLQADKLDSEAKGSTFASAFKRVLLSRDELLQLSAVQCVAEVLCHHMDYGRVLLTADIAEFLFEALSSKNELLLSALFSCLNSLATVDDFYTKCHVLYGIEALLNGLSTALQLRAHTAAQTGFNLLINIFKRQPGGMCLFPTLSGLQKLLEVIRTALLLKFPTITQLATSVVTNLLSSHHFPPNLPLSTLFPLLALLLHLIEPLTTPTPASTRLADGMLSAGEVTIEQKKLLGEVLQTFSKCYRSVEASILSCTSDSSLVVTDDDIVFLLRAFEESLTPALLLHMDSIDDSECFTSLFTMATCHLSISNATTACAFAEKLAYGAFINMIFDMKAKFLTAEGYKDLCCAGNELLVSICSQVAKRSYLPSTSVSFVSDTLKTALPNINCSAEGCLQYLSQKAPNILFQRKSGHVTSGSPPIVVLQHATLLLLHCAYSHQDILVPPMDVMKSLHKYLSLNPGIHQLPPVVLHCLASVFAAIKAVCDTSSTHQTDLAKDATHLLVQGLERVGGPSQLCVYGDTTLLLWAFHQPSLQQTLAKTLLLEWLRLVNADKRNDTSTVVNALLKSLPATRCLLGLLAETTDDTVPLNVALDILQALVLKETHLKVRTEIIGSLQDIITKQRVDPIPENSLVVILKLLTKSLDCSKEEIGLNITKLIYKVTSMVTRTSFSNAAIIEQGIHLIRVLLSKHKEDTQITTLLLNNFPFLQRVGSFLSDSTTPKGHNSLSASALHLLAHVLESQFNLNIKAPQSIHLKLASVLTALSSTFAPAQVAGLELWQVVFSRGSGGTGFIELESHRSTKQCSYNNMNLLRTILFLVLNCLLNDSGIVREIAAKCAVEVLNHVNHVKGDVVYRCHHWANTLLNYLVETYHSSNIPLVYIPTIAVLLSSSNGPSNCTHFKHLSQLLYKTYLALPADLSALDKAQHTEAFRTCFAKMQEVDRDVLNSDQWATVRTTQETL